MKRAAWLLAIGAYGLGLGACSPPDQSNGDGVSGGPPLAGSPNAGSAGASTAGGSAGGTGGGAGLAGSASAGFAGAAGSSGAGLGGQAGASAGFGGAAGVGGAAGGDAGGGSGGAAPGPHWVGTWSASPYYDADNQPVASLSKAVLRQVTHVSLGGSQLRVQLSNLFGDGPVVIDAVHVALCKAKPAVDSSIDTTTDRALTFAGQASVTIPAGQELWSDPLDFSLAPLSNVTITAAFGNVPSQVVGHSGSRTTSYLQPASSDVSVASLPNAKTVDHWYYISGIDVMAPAAARAVVVIGDSITDGRGTDTNKNNRWTDVLAARLQANAATADVAVLNQGIGATNLVGTTGTAAQARFERDVLGQSGVGYALVYDGVNDIGTDVSFDAMQPAYADLIARAHAKGLPIYAATIMPFNGNTYYTAARESVRQQVNAYLKSGVFDAYIDFDAALSAGGNPPKLQSAYATWAQTDWLHPGPTGYQKMGETVKLELFQP